MGKIPHQKEIEETLEFGRRMNEDPEFRDRIVKILLSPREDKVNEEKKEPHELGGASDTKKKKDATKAQKKKRKKKKKKRYEVQYETDRYEEYKTYDERIDRLNKWRIEHPYHGM